jgi:hypothetical protein
MYRPLQSGVSQAAGVNGAGVATGRDEFSSSIQGGGTWDPEVEAAPESASVPGSGWVVPGSGSPAGSVSCCGPSTGAQDMKSKQKTTILRGFSFCGVFLNIKGSSALNILRMYRSEYEKAISGDFLSLTKNECFSILQTL